MTTEELLGQIHADLSRSSDSCIRWSASPRCGTDMNEADLLLAGIEAAAAVAWWRCPHGDAALEAHICWGTPPTASRRRGIERQIAPRELAGHEGEKQTTAHLQLLRLAQQLTDDLGARGLLAVALAEGEDIGRALVWLVLSRPPTSTSAPRRGYFPRWKAMRVAWLALARLGRP